MSPNSPPKFQTLADVFEPSAIEQLPDGRFLVVEDDSKHPFTFLQLPSDGRIHSSHEARIDGGEDPVPKLNDLEGLTHDGLGHFYAITSHSRNRKGAKKSSRNSLVRFRVEADRIVEIRIVKRLRAALIAAHPVLATAARIRKVKKDGGFNIEALAFSPDQQQLWVGFRSPLHRQRAIIASIENLASMFDCGERPRIGKSLVTLDLDGDGIRSMCFVPTLRGYMITAGPASSAHVQFRLWFWNGLPGDAARHVSVAGLDGFEHAEGVCPAIIEGRALILIVSDDGNRSQSRHARYLLLEPAQLVIAA